VPILPFVFFGGGLAIVLSAVCSAAALFGIGALITLMTGRGVLFSGTRQVLVGLAAAALTFGLGAVIGGSV
jgi:vacuolar iron transporter family protein